MTRRTVWAAIVAVGLVGGCSAVERGSPSSAPSAVPSRSSMAASSAEQPRRPLPSGFPVLPGAVAMELPSDDTGLIGLWETAEQGSAAYDFYLDALPAGGYPIVGLYPGGAVALIRFMAQGEVWQMVAHGMADGRVAIEIRLDRP